jgi:hypothetical protein
MPCPASMVKRKPCRQRCSLVREASLGYKRQHCGERDNRAGCAGDETFSQLGWLASSVVHAARGRAVRYHVLLPILAFWLDPWHASTSFAATYVFERSEFLFSHIFVFSFLPAFAVGLISAGFKHSVAQFVWLVPAVVLAYKFLTFPASSVLQSQFQVAFHQYFGSGFQIPQFRDWHEFWIIMRTNPDMLRGKAQLDFTAPFYAGIGYSVAAWIGRRSNLNQKVSEGVKNWENSRFEHRL